MMTLWNTEDAVVERLPLMLGRKVKNSRRQRAIDKRAKRVATFGSVASNHALATALYARRLDLDCTCLLSHQVNSPAVVKVLQQLLQCGAEIVRYGGDYRSRVGLMRRHVQRRRTWVIPLGGSSWLGTVGYVAAGLVSVLEGAVQDLGELVERLRKAGVSEHQSAAVAKALTPFAASLGKDGAPAPDMDRPDLPKGDGPSGHGR